MKNPVYLIGGADVGKTTLRRLIEEKGLHENDVIVLSIDEAKDRGLTITNTFQKEEFYELRNNRIELFKPPLTRRERRKQKRSKI